MAQHGKEIVVTAYDQVATKYDDQYQSPRCFAENMEFFRGVKMDGRVLDVGCGTGLILEYVPLEPEKYVGVDISKGMLEVARDRYPEHTFFEADMRQMPLEDGSIDTLVSGFTAFNYVPDHEDVIREFKRVLAPGGQLWLNALGPRCVVRDTYALYVNGCVVPRYPINADRLKSMFERAGFYDVSIRGMTIAADRLIPDWAPRWAAQAFIRLESRTVGRLCPSAGDFILLHARRD